MLDLAEIAAQALPGLARGLLHDADEAGNWHVRFSLSEDQFALPT